MTSKKLLPVYGETKSKGLAKAFTIGAGFIAGEPTALALDGNIY